MPDSNASWWTRVSQSLAEGVGLDGAIENLANWWEGNDPQEASEVQRQSQEARDNSSDALQNELNNKFTQTFVPDDGESTSGSVGQKEYFSTRESYRQGRFAFRGNDQALVYPSDLAVNSFDNRQVAAIRFAPFKRSSTQLGVNLTEQGTQIGALGDDGQLVDGFSANFGALFDSDPNQSFDAQTTTQLNDGVFQGAYGQASAGNEPTEQELNRFVQKIASDVRLSKANGEQLEEIYLYCPNGLQFNDSVGYKDASAGNLNAVLEAASGNFEAGIDKLKLLGIGEISKFAGRLPFGVLDDSDVANFFTARFGIVENQRQESVFENVNRKKFSFEFVFAPRNPDEATTVQNIIEAFRFHMMPELSLSGAMLLAPHEFEVEILYRPSSDSPFKPNPSIPQIGRAFLEDININYSPNEKSAFFYDGVPVQISATLTFNQALILNRQLILAGF